MKSWHELLQGLQSNLILRLGVTAEELFSLGARAGLHLWDSEGFCNALNKYVAIVSDTSKHGADNNSDIIKALGPVDAASLVNYFRRSPVAFSADSTSASDLGESVAAARGKLDKYLLQHILVTVLSTHSQALAGVTEQAWGTLRRLLCILAAPVTAAARDATVLLPYPSKQEITKYFPHPITAPTTGQYGIFTKQHMQPLVPGIRMTFIKGSRTRPADGIMHSFCLCATQAMLNM